MFLAIPKHTSIASKIVNMDFKSKLYDASTKSQKPSIHLFGACCPNTNIVVLLDIFSFDNIYQYVNDDPELLLISTTICF